jgi:AcrR family transcriptional regulator
VQPARWTLVYVPSSSRIEERERLSADARREALLDATKALVTRDGPGAVTMGTVAARAGVTRALVYKHFDNKDELLVALYRREATALDRAMREVVVAAGPGLEAKLRALVEVVIDSADRHGPFFHLLRGAATSGRARSDRRSWDRRTLRYFASLVTAETALDERTALTATSLILTPLQTLRAHSLRDPQRREFYIDTYLDLVLGGLERLRRDRRSMKRLSV